MVNAIRFPAALTFTNIQEAATRVFCLNLLMTVA